jgi:hypothetical protein
MQGMTAQQAHARHEQPPEGSVASDRQDRIVGAGGEETAAWTEKGGNTDLVEPDQTDKALFWNISANLFKHEAFFSEDFPSPGRGPGNSGRA